ncbi:MAG TPA: sodium:proton antiporter [Xanthobacteraceae bacterium]|nr:sodium:proton antiporter [Xanthobacteraceae bacterium]
MKRRIAAWLAAGLSLSANPAGASTVSGTIDGAAMAWPWAVPFAALLLCIATGPLLFPRVWHGHYGKIAFAWSVTALAALAAFQGAPATLAAFIHVMLAEYLSFILLLFTLYVVAGGILVTGNFRGTPLVNTSLLALGTSMASFVGTTGAAMILIRPLLRANAERSHRAHTIVFFIILVANVGGALTPLGDPPLFVGFLRGVDFFWTAQHLWMQTAIVAVPILVLYLAIDSCFCRREMPPETRQPLSLQVRGKINLVLIALVIATLLGAAMWNPGIVFDVYGTPLALEDIARNTALILIALASLRLTPREHRESNGFTWEPIREVAELFAGIFVTIIPVIAMLAAGRNGAFAWLLRVVTEPGGQPNEVAYFWLTGALSAFLDNAPTYLVFFELAGGHAPTLMGPLAGTLGAISMGAVYMGALTYIGNAPNFMIYAIAQERGVRMPSFFAYMLWAALILVPLFLLLTWLPIAPILRSA